MNIRNTCYITGHHHTSLPYLFDENHLLCKKIKEVLKQHIKTLIEDASISHFITGMALGIEQDAAEIILELKEKYQDITLECVLPYETQAAWWTEKQRERYYHIIELCDKETLFQTKFSMDCMRRSSEYMINQSNYLVTVWNGRKGPIEQSIDYAKQLNRMIFIINPYELKLMPKINSKVRFVN